MQVLLKDLAPGQDYAIQFRSNDGRGNTSDWSQVQRFTTTNDTMPPANVTNLSFYTSGTSFIAQWDQVTTNADGTALKDFRNYHVHISCVGTSGVADFYIGQPNFEFSQEQNLAAFGTFQNALSIAVTAVDNTYNESRVPATATINPLAPPAPSTPVVSNYLGLLMASWDGLAGGGGAMPSNMDYVEVHVSTVSQFTPDTTTFVGKIRDVGNGAKYIVGGLTYNTLYYVRFVAVNLLGLKSGPSTQGSGTPSNITGLDIQNGQIAAEQINWTATNIPGGNAYYSTTAPTTNVNGGTTFGAQDVWYDTGHAYKSYQWTSANGWQPANVGFIAGSKLIAATITADAVGANQIITSKANIGTAVIDHSNIQSVDAGTITVGVMQSANQVAVNGVNSPAWSLDMNGVAVLNSAHSGNYISGSQGWAINPDGSVEFNTGTFRGDLITGHTGSRHTEIVNTGVSSVNFYSDTGAVTFIQARTRTNWNGLSGTYEAIYVQAQSPTAASNASDFWNSILVSSHESIEAYTGEFDLGYRDDFYLQRISDETATGLTSGSTSAMWVDTNRKFEFYFKNYFSVYSSGTDPTLYASFRVVDNSNTGSNLSPSAALHSASGYGGAWRTTASSAAVYMDAQFWDQSGWITVRGYSFGNMSDARLKANIRDTDEKFLDDVMNMKIRKYERSHVNPHMDDETKHVKINTTELGFIAQEVPTRVLTGQKIVEDDMNSIDLYSLTVQLYGAFQEAVTELRGEIAGLKSEITQLQRGKANGSIG